MAEDKDAEIAALKARLDQLEAPRPAAAPAFTAKDAGGCLTGLIVVGVIGWIVAASSCHTKSESELAAEADAKIISDARWTVRSSMKDPDSVQFGDLTISRVSGRVAVCGTVNARNGFGGYVGYKPFFVAEGVMVSADRLPAEAFAKAFVQHCRKA